MSLTGLFSNARSRLRGDLKAVVGAVLAFVLLLLFAANAWKIKISLDMVLKSDLNVSEPVSASQVRVDFKSYEAAFSRREAAKDFKPSRSAPPSPFGSAQVSP